MIKFEATLKVDTIEDKSVPKRDGDTFEFTEVVLSNADKYPVSIVARLANATQKELIKTGRTYPFTIGIASYKRQDGRIWNNFIVDSVNISEDDNGPAEYVEDGDIPF